MPGECGLPISESRISGTTTRPESSCSESLGGETVSAQTPTDLEALMWARLGTTREEVLEHIDNANPNILDTFVAYANRSRGVGPCRNPDCRCRCAGCNEKGNDSACRQH